MARYEIFVTYKKGIFDPPGATAERALANLGYDGVEEVKIGKYIRLDVPTATLEDACARCATSCSPTRSSRTTASRRSRRRSRMRFGVVIFPGSNCEQDVVHAARYLGFEAELRLARRHRPLRLRRDRAAGRLLATATTSAAARSRASRP